MNTYNENLRFAVLNTLSIQELDLKKLRSQKNAALFTLYHARGAQVTAGRKLEAANKVRDLKAGISKQATDCSNLANNQLASATLADQYTRLSVTDIAACAANVQVAANAILRLAGDIGNVLSILQAGDQGSPLYKSAAHINELINDTAKSAEAASELAMQASALTAEVSSPTVLDQSKNTNVLMNNLLKICSADFTAASQGVTATQDHLETAAAGSNVAEGNLQDTTAELDAAALAYRTMNKELNLNLNVDGLTETSFVVRFDPIVSIFEAKITPTVQDYYIILVKDNERANFMMGNAEYILQEGEQGHRLIKIPGVKPDVPCSHTIKFKDVTIRDADGDKIRYGQTYVVFLLATYTRAHQKEINDFSHYLSAPSNTFVLTMGLPKASIITKTETTIRFHAKNNLLCEVLPEYRCILLPVLNKSSFVFDLAIAQQVPAGNYTVADGTDQYAAAIGSWTTDNFGNPLIDGAEYEVLILTTPAGMVEDTDRFSDVLSDRNIHSKFQYQIKNPS